jgi:hypothetical protein
MLWMFLAGLLYFLSGVYAQKALQAGDTQAQFTVRWRFWGRKTWHMRKVRYNRFFAGISGPLAGLATYLLIAMA